MDAEYMKTLRAPIIGKLGLLFLLAMVMAAMGCHTANGFGKDLQDAGEGIQNGTNRLAATNKVPSFGWACG